MGAGKRLNGRGKKSGEEKSRAKVGAPEILLLTDQFRNHLKSLPVIGHISYCRVPFLPGPFSLFPAPTNCPGSPRMNMQ